jgi:hypothetical protein
MELLLFLLACSQLIPGIVSLSCKNLHSTYSEVSYFGLQIDFFSLCKECFHCIVATYAATYALGNLSCFFCLTLNMALEITQNCWYVLFFGMVAEIIIL